MPDQEKDAAFVQIRFRDMEVEKDDFDDRWEINNRRKFSFLINDGATHLPNAWVVANDITEEITNEFDGSVAFVPTIESSVREGFQHEQLSRIYNQENQKINVQKERHGAIYDAVCYGIGVLFEGYISVDDPDVDDAFKGLITERVDPRDFFIDDHAVQFFDPQGINGANDCIRRRRYSKPVFKRLFSRAPFDQGVVERVLKGGGIGDSRDNFSIINEERENVAQEDEIELLEYWDDDNLIIQPRFSTEILYKGPNPYGKKPFVVYVTSVEFETIYPPSVLELIAPILKQKDIAVNYWKELTKLLATPVIFADEETGLIAGQALKGGVQTMTLDGVDIRQKVQQVQLGNDPSPLINLISFLDDEFTVASGKDVKALLAAPQELATQTKQKIATQVKRLRGIIRTMMQDAESQRAMLRGRNIIKFIFNKKRDVLINDFTTMESGELRALAGSQATIEINDQDWKEFEFNVIIKSKAEDEVTKEKTRDQLNTLVNSLTQFFQQFPELRETFNPEEFVKQWLETWPDLDISQLFRKDEGESSVTQALEKASRGEQVDSEMIASLGRKGKDDFISKVGKRATEADDPLLRRQFTKLLLQANETRPEEFSDEAARAVQGVEAEIPPLQS